MKVLVADDSPSFRAALTRTLVENGYTVIKARDGVEALSMFYAERPDVVLLDLLMPRLTGWVVCRIIKEDPVFGRTPVLAITGADQAENKYWAERSGADAFISKDDLADGILERIRATLTSQALADLVGIDGRASVAPELGDVDVLARVCGLLDRKLFESTISNDITAIAALTLDLRQSLERTLETLHHLVDFDAAAVGLVEERVVGIWTPRRLDPWIISEFHTRVVRHLDEAASGSLLASSFTQWVGTGGASLGAGGGFRSEYLARLQSHGRVIGSFALASSSPEGFDDRAHRTLRSIAPAIVTVVDSARLYHRTLGTQNRAAG